MKRTTNLGENLHKAVKVAAAKEGITIEAYIAKVLWFQLGGVRHA